MRPLFGQYDYMFENLIQNMYMFELQNIYLSYKTDPLFYPTKHLSLPKRAKQSN